MSWVILHVILYVANSLYFVTSDLDSRYSDLIAKGVKPKTRITHQASWKIWLDFCRVQDMLDDVFMTRCSPRTGVLRAINFLMWLEDDNRKQGAIKVIISGLRFTYECNVQDHSIFEHPSFTRAIAGVGIVDKSVNLRKAPSKSLVWILQFNVAARAAFWLTGNQDSQMTYIATTLLFHFSLRIGEIAKIGPYGKAPLYTDDHRFYWCDILLEDAVTPSIQYSFAKFKSMSPRPAIGLILLLKNSSKTSGRVRSDGKPYFLGPGSEEETTFFQDFMRWIELCNHTLEGEPICSRLSHSLSNPQMKRTTSKEVVTLMNAIGAEHDLLGFTGKSLRGGGSSALAAAGHSDAIMLNSVGHVSHASNQHYQTGTASTNHYALGTGLTISCLDVQRTATINKLNRQPQARKQGALHPQAPLPT